MFLKLSSSLWLRDYFMIVISARGLRGIMEQLLYPFISCCIVACIEYVFKVLRDPLYSRR